VDDQMDHGLAVAGSAAYGILSPQDATHGPIRSTHAAQRT